jgi:hypothetical protein
LGAEKGGGCAEIADEACAGFFAGWLVGCAEDGRGMDSSEDGRQVRWVEDFAVILGDAECAAEQRLGGRGAEADDERWMDGFNFGIEPGAAGGHFASAGLLMNAPLATRLPFEMLDGIRDVDGVAIDAGLDEAAVEEQTGGADEGLAFDIFAVAGLFADEDEAGVRSACAEDGLRCVLVEGTSAAIARSLTQGFEGAALGEEAGGRN